MAGAAVQVPAAVAGATIAVAAVGTAAVRTEADDLSAILKRALRLQLAGRYDEADRCYTRALAIDPQNFDALHMGGVVAYQKNDFDRARQLIEAALAVQPRSVDAMMNMELVQRAFAADNEFDRYTLAHLPRYCALDAQAGTITAQQLAASLDGQALHLLVPPARAALPAQRFAQALTQALQSSLYCWSTHAAEPLAGLPAPRVIEPGFEAPGGCLIVLGSDVDAGAWASADAWRMRWLFCDSPAPGPLVDRLRQLSAHGRHRVGLLFAAAALARRLKLPGRVFVDTEKALVGAA